VISVDAGGYFRPEGPGSAAINEIMAEALDKIPVDVFNLTADDLHYWPTLSQVKFTRAKVISTNLTAPSSASALAPYAIQTLKVGDAEVRIGFLGLADTSRVPPRSGFSGVDPLEAVAKIKDKVLQEADFLVVLADLPGDIVKKLADANPEIYAIIAMERRFFLGRPAQIQNAVVLNTVERGRFLGRLVVGLDSSGKVDSYKPDMIEMNAKVPESEFFAERIRQLPAGN